jgi:hypothetical protein
MDTTAVVTAIDGIGPAVSAVGAALVGVAAIAVGWKWLKGAIFG